MIEKAMGDRYLGLDFGEKTIGIALSDLSNILAQPFCLLERKGTKTDLQEISKIIQENKITGVIIGLPLNMDGSQSAMAKKVLNFSKKLEQKLSIPIHTWDERLSTQAAERALLEGDLSRKKRKKVIDKVAAALILQGWLDCHAQIKNEED